MKKVKTAYRFLPILFLLICSIQLSTWSCTKKEEPDVSKEDLNEKYLKSGTWKLERATVDNVNQTNTYKDLTLNFSTSIYNSTNGRIIWPEEGSWEFIGSDKTVIKRGDGLEITIQNITAEKMILSFNWDHTHIDTGRSNAISGFHIFEFIK
ncbi:hypothetical protein ACFOUP_08005 [Belliella kenyensis]|uniref:Lipocalin-like domain-containing protein n=1 Tax=Belliella kenyensis TaxID=1472724 RepID=A0ABV8EKY7_9BACT|nr:hypothetical protein [Belliella kenyensis]MCH7400417.1 hypothetical protein [Belliella kenyensis]MDN3604566.1 hypothetical protein [Belliella kenyensis]